MSKNAFGQEIATCANCNETIFLKAGFSTENTGNSPQWVHYYDGSPTCNKFKAVPRRKN